MKDWQKGIELDKLLEHEKTWVRYNERCLSPFGEMKKHKIAAAIDAGHYDFGHEHAIKTRILKAKSKIKMFASAEIPIAIAQKGDRYVDCMAYNQPDPVIQKLRLYDEDTFLFIQEEDPTERMIAHWSHYEKIGTKYSTFSDITGIYYNGNRKFKPIPETENINAKKSSLNFDHTIINQLVTELIGLGLQYTDHNSNYNKSLTHCVNNKNREKSWKVLSLLGYEEDSAYIDKVAKGKEIRTIVKTDLFDKVPLVQYFLDQLPGRFDRVRFMSLEPGGGELFRHTDQTDPSWGTVNGKMMRFHIPLQTNDKVVFNSWNNEGKQDTFSMNKGECWFLDTRRPHTAVNNGDDIRIHLVVDVFANDKIRQLVT